MVQVCVDSPVAAHDEEVAFWRAFLPGRWVDSVRASSPASGTTTPGLLSSCSSSDWTSRTAGPGAPRPGLGRPRDRGPQALDLGADDIGRGRGGWWTLRDPAGLAFCVTLNSPEHKSQHRNIG